MFKKDRKSSFQKRHSKTETDRNCLEALKASDAASKTQFWLCSIYLSINFGGQNAVSDRF